MDFVEGLFGAPARPFINDAYKITNKKVGHIIFAKTSMMCPIFLGDLWSFSILSLQLLFYRMELLKMLLKHDIIYIDILFKQGEKLDMFRDYTEKAPKYLYKYYSNLMFAKAAIEEKRIHLELPSDYNDVFDSAISVNEENLKNVLFDSEVLCMMQFFIESQYKEILSNLYEEKLFDCRYMDQVFEVLNRENIPPEVIKRLKTNICNKIANSQAKNNRITCFSETNDSELMWAHYGKHLEGVCLCYDTSLDKTLFENAHKVVYSLNRPRLEMNNFNIYFNKSLAWDYEQEWRIVINTQDEYKSTNSCVGIIVGEKLDLDNTLAFMGYNITHKMKIYKAKADVENYKINIQKILGN